MNINIFNQDFHNKLPAHKIEALDLESGAPVASTMYQTTPAALQNTVVHAPHERGLSAAAVVEAENALKLYPIHDQVASDDFFNERYQAYTLDRDEQDRRYQSVSM